LSPPPPPVVVYFIYYFSVCLNYTNKQISLSGTVSLFYYQCVLFGNYLVSKFFDLYFVPNYLTHSPVFSWYYYQKYSVTPWSRVHFEKLTVLS
jgi:hypothetical protein